MTQPQESGWRDLWARYGWLLLAASPLGVYELVALFSGKVPTITTSWRDTQASHWYVHLIFLAGWALLTSHLLGAWP